MDSGPDAAELIASSFQTRTKGLIFNFTTRAIRGTWAGLESRRRTARQPDSRAGTQHSERNGRVFRLAGAWRDAGVAREGAGVGGQVSEETSGSRKQKC